MKCSIQCIGRFFHFGQLSYHSAKYVLLLVQQFLGFLHLCDQLCFHSLFSSENHFSELTEGFAQLGKLVPLVMLHVLQLLFSLV